ncbi:hypothetical protein CRENBAI_009374 [Crenichthys baileyi]|uniref:Uncharacterized protein n=1 Tax=Crenichthys baileyi TaxID=28760 RepID=A0AAV9QYF6_9TELE
MISCVISDYDSGDLVLLGDRSSPFFLLFRSSGQVESALRTPPILLLSVAEVALPLPRLPPLRHPARLLQRILLRSSSHSPGFDVFFYSGHPTIFPASFISSMDSLQHPISSLTQLLWKFASNSAFPLLALPIFNPLLGPSH